MVQSDLSNENAFIQEKIQSLPRIERKLESTNKKIVYLVKRINQLSKTQNGGGIEALTQERLIRVAEKLRNLGLLIEYSDGRGYLKLKAIDQKGLDTLKRLNTVFPISIIESFLDNTGG